MTPTTSTTPHANRLFLQKILKDMAWQTYAWHKYTPKCHWTEWIALDPAERDRVSVRPNCPRPSSPPTLKFEPRKMYYSTSGIPRTNASLRAPISCLESRDRARSWLLSSTTSPVVSLHVDLAPDILGSIIVFARPTEDILNDEITCIYSTTRPQD